MLTASSLVLVCLLPKPRDLEIARLFGWYRIPLRSAPKLIAVDYLALYQPASFGDQGGMIEFTTEVKGHELISRAELFRDEPDHPNAREEYFKIQIGELERLDNPIVADKWKRITFLYTTGEYLLEAKTINDLVVKNGERRILWQTLREKARTSDEYKPYQEPLEISDEILEILLGIREVKQ